MLLVPIHAPERAELARVTLATLPATSDGRPFMKRQVRPSPCMRSGLLFLAASDAPTARDGAGVAETASPASADTVAVVASTGASAGPGIVVDGPGAVTIYPTSLAMLVVAFVLALGIRAAASVMIVRALAGRATHAWFGGGWSGSDEHDSDAERDAAG